MLKDYRFAILITLISTMIFYLSPSLSENFKAKSSLQQSFVEARVTDVVSNELAPDLRVPSILTGKQVFNAEILEGPETGKIVEIQNPLSRQHNVLVEQGDVFIMMIRITGREKVYWAYNHKRSTAIYWMGFSFVLLLLSFGKKEGFHSIVSLYFTAALIIGVLIPSIFAGFNPVPITIMLMGIKIVVNFILVSGYNRKSFCAMGGTLLGVIAAGIMAQVFGEFAHLSGIYLDKGEDVIYISNQVLQVRWLMFVAIMISALGAVMDVAISIASAYNELRITDPKLSPTQLMRASMNIGRDIMGTMTNTLILAFAGSSLTTIMMVWGLDMPLTQFINTPVIALAIIHALAGSVGIVLTIPLTAWLARYMLSPSSVMPKEAVATATDSTAADVITNAINIEPTTALNPANEN
ncbi:YibE/F family protein [Shewanella sp. Actino-trap-3]|uniref:YibE/F family protein n=1 Tax=Shewanella sp. Actino-trap-3 TaxID=2058331 RepID=UPI000C33FB03|nr:YibE/F family protein [Shewanella sp. Actino-trap-3]PKG77235.1 YibE/F family protein [Shewanella sp. Actino-trap-3]|tara:strand:+ start:49916 stop:51145 length:1230 start_codon:yes stop_codon:yes gene_type:complete